LVNDETFDYISKRLKIPLGTVIRKYNEAIKELKLLIGKEEIYG